MVKPNVVAPRTAHPAFDKACQYFKIEVSVRAQHVVQRSQVKVRDKYFSWFGSLLLPKHALTLGRTAAEGARGSEHDVRGRARHGESH